MTVGFSEPMNATTINTTNIRIALTSAPGTPLPATVTYDPATRVATLTPAAPLASNANYTVTVPLVCRTRLTTHSPCSRVWTFDGAGYDCADGGSYRAC